MTKKTFHELAEALLEKQLLLTDKLNGLLQQEYDTLHMRHGESIDVLSNEKQPIILNIDTLNQHWLALLELEGASLNVDAIKTFLQEYDAINSTMLLSLWEKLLAKAIKCQRLNTINGATLMLQNQVTQQAIAILRGHTPGNTLYNFQGSEMPNFAGGRSIAKA